jgi:hypothetical protein
MNRYRLNAIRSNKPVRLSLKLWQLQDSDFRGIIHSRIIPHCGIIP